MSLDIQNGLIFRERETTILINIADDSGISCSAFYSNRITNRDDRNLLYQFIQRWDVETNHLCEHFGGKLEFNDDV